MSDWTSDSNEALSLSMVRATADKGAESDGDHVFHPHFTYPIYGEEEKIYGYKDVVIDLRFTSGSLVQYLGVTYSQKLPSSTVDDVEGTLANFIPPGYLKDEPLFLRHVEDDSLSFRPHGEKVYSYARPSQDSQRKGKGKAVYDESTQQENDGAITYEVYHSTWDAPGFKEYHRRLQLFVLLYIEGGSYINEDEDCWEFMVLYEKGRRKGSQLSTYHFVGYSSLYNFYHFPERVRMRLSQFVILPPYQRQGHGSELYMAIYQYILSQPRVAELTVEDPAEAFEDLRDKNDLKMILSHEQFMKEAFGERALSHGGGRVRGVGKSRKKGAMGKLSPPADKAWMDKWRRDLKIAGRQFHRLVEMLILSRLDPLNGSAIRNYRLQVKERLYRFNYEILAQLDKQERLEKLEETFQSVRDDYQRILKLAGCF